MSHRRYLWFLLAIGVLAIGIGILLGRGCEAPIRDSEPEPTQQPSERDRESDTEADIRPSDRPSFGGDFPDKTGSGQSEERSRGAARSESPQVRDAINQPVSGETGRPPVSPTRAAIDGSAGDGAERFATSGGGATATSASASAD